MSEPGEPAEREADRMADAIMRQPRSDPGDAHGEFQHLDANAPAPGGRPLPTDTHRFFADRFGRDFSHVRLHIDAASAASARMLEARAYTLGSDIVFAEREYNPHSQAGMHLLAHELTHVVQQATGATTIIQRTPTFAQCDRQDSTNPRSESALTAAAGQAKVLASDAYDVLVDTFPRSQYRAAIAANFGALDPAQMQTVTDRYAKIRDTMESKELTCRTECPQTKDKKESCARGEENTNVIQICPHFGASAGCEPVSTLLHEAAHNAGAMSHTYKENGGYPGANAQDNAVAYELFPFDLAKDPAAPAPSRKPEAESTFSAE